MLPDAGVPIQLIHEPDVGSAVLAAAVGAGPPGVYNLAGEGEITMSDLAHAVGDYAVPSRTCTRRRRQPAGVPAALDAA